MLSESEAKAFITEIFEEEGLIIGGLVATHEVSDDFVWRLMKNLDAVRTNSLRRLATRRPGTERPGAPPDHLQPHPAIAEFLQTLRRSH